MNYDSLTFEGFKDLDKETRNKLLNDKEALKAMVRNNVSNHRYLHCLSVADVCKSLAEAHGIDKEKAYITGLLHDCCKFPGSDDVTRNEEILRKYEPSKINGIKGAYHSWAAPYYLRENLGFKDEEILNAIYNHTICKADDPLSLILYIADKREPLRNIDDDILDLAYTDLNKAYEKLLLNVKEYLERKNERFIKDCI